MFRKVLPLLAAMLFTATAFAAVDANKGNAADLDGIKGIGPAMSQRILDARKKSEFKDWPDFMQRVKGMKEKKAAKLSLEGLTVNGKPFESSVPAADTGKAKPAKPPKA